MAVAEEEYERGRIAGEIAARLAGHDLHLATINGSLADVAREMHDMLLAVQRLGDQADARDKTTLATASALKAADEARRAKSDSAWSPVQKLIAGVAGLAGLATLILGIRALIGN